MAKVDRESRKNCHQMENPEERHLRALVLIGRRGREPGQAIAFGTALSVPGGCHTGVRRCQMSGGKRESHYAVALHPAAYGCLGRPGGLSSTKLEVHPEMLRAEGERSRDHLAVTRLKGILENRLPPNKKQAKTKSLPNPQKKVTVRESKL